MRHVAPHRVAAVVIATACAFTMVAASAHAANGRLRAAEATDAVTGVGASPLRIDVDVPAGKSVTRSVVITNTQDSAVRLTFSKQDIDGNQADPDGTPRLLGGKVDTALSGYDWLDVPRAVTVPPGQSRTVDVKVTAPARSTGSHYAALIVEGGVATSGPITAQSRLAVVFLMNAGGVRPPEIVISDVKQKTPTKTVVTYINKGRRTARPRVTIITRDPITHQEISRTTMTCPAVLAGGGKRRCTVDSRSSSADTSTNDNTLIASHLGTERSVSIAPEDASATDSASLPTTWAATWLSLILPLVGIALFIIYFLFLRRRRKDDEDETDPGDGELAIASWD